MNNENSLRGSMEYLKNTIKKDEDHLFVLESDSGGFSPRGFSFDSSDQIFKKVENWNQTISSIPMQTLISNSFKNWRQMGQSSGRRIKRSILIDANSIEFVKSDLMDTFNELPLLKEYLNQKEKELEDYNNSDAANSKKNIQIQRRLTNIGTFRAYCFEYLKKNPSVNSELTLIVRQLEPTEGGIPLEIWTYSATTNWIAYESIQSDIFDHLYSVLHEFNLRVYQKPSGEDIKSIAQSS